jgi:uncharacterized C2H2 Zn-finger protein
MRCPKCKVLILQEKEPIHRENKEKGLTLTVVNVAIRFI